MRTQIPGLAYWDPEPANLSFAGGVSYDGPTNDEEAAVMARDVALDHITRYRCLECGPHCSALSYRFHRRDAASMSALGKPLPSNADEALIIKFFCRIHPSATLASLYPGVSWCVLA